MDMMTAFKALGDPVRLRLFHLLALKHELCVCHLTQALAMPQSTISRHLGVLRNAELLTTRRHGKWMFYQLADDVPEPLTQLLTDSQEARAQAAQDMKRLDASLGC